MLTNTARIDESAIFMDEKATEVKANQTSRQRATAGTGSFRVVDNGKIQYRANCINCLGMQVRKSFTADTKEECIAKRKEAAITSISCCSNFTPGCVWVRSTH